MCAAVFGWGVNWNKSLSTENTFPKMQQEGASNGYFIVTIQTQNRREACRENLREAGYDKLLR